jgi:hypothetical protein
MTLIRLYNFYRHGGSSRLRSFKRAWAMSKR